MATDVAVVATAARKLDETMDTRTLLREVQLPELAVFGGSSPTPTDVVVRTNGITIVAANGAIGREMVAIPDASSLIGPFEVCATLSASQLVAALQGRVAAAGAALSEAYRPAAAGLTSLRFDAPSQTMYASAWIRVIQQGGENPCEWEVEGNESIELEVVPVRQSWNSYAIRTGVIGGSEISITTRWRQDWSPCELILPEEFVNFIVGLFVHAHADLSDIAFSLDVALPNVNYLVLRVLDDSLLILGTVEQC